MLTCEQARIYEKGLTGIPFTDEREESTYYDMIQILRAIAKTQPSAYVGDENSPNHKSFSHTKYNL